MFLLTNYISKNHCIPGISSRTHKINNIVMSPIMTNIAIPYYATFIKVFKENNSPFRGPNL